MVILVASHNRVLARSFSRYCLGSIPFPKASLKNNNSYNAANPSGRKDRIGFNQQQPPRWNMDRRSLSWVVVSSFALSSGSVTAFHNNNINSPRPGSSSSSSGTTTRLLSVSAYAGVPSDGKEGTEQLDLPVRMKLPKSDGVGWRHVEVDTFKTKQEIEAGMDLMNDVITDGKTWPFESTFETDEAYRGYFLSHAAFVVRTLDETDRDVAPSSVLGCFYIKPNFPGRCSHICNGGFIVNPIVRGSRVGTLMGACFLRFAKDLGYRGAYFNLVFESNETSIRLWERLGFDRVAVIPNAARLEGMPIDQSSGETKLDTAFGYYYDLDTLPNDYDPVYATYSIGFASLLDEPDEK